MKKIIFLGALIPLSLVFACVKTARKNQTPSKNGSCGLYEGKTLYKDNQHNCFYLNESGLKEYVANTNCSCI